ncbi:uncharacterized membrane protein YcgQ (UPF0703/DUF1980 family) [Enterococcus sp. PF1-24]|uniref:hypothetical protein n=1 Tax=unclassified Enterococcus TaxID=2608891 RepID=UPI0024762BBE|nr:MULTISPECIES: hypothetical protein [unclassified Enterococcus]MDH6364367.1 uncharacterized membrane protein YcgQ (UPF0703/DUF1980 family) [Enterococcus sp. PFB1-1]MDH6401444.1 uncharacterized membrane protein YcgQ (UPF0703/DUF1980 family) [Enterococcus sp. PF1-24]
MKKRILGLLLVTLFTTGCQKEDSKTTTNTTITSSSEEVNIELKVNRPILSLEKNELIISGIANEGAEIIVKQEDKKVASEKVKNEKFEISMELLESEEKEVELIVTDGETKKEIKVFSKKHLEKLKADADKKAKEEEEKQAAEKATAEKKAQEDAARKAEEERQAEEKRAQEAAAAAEAARASYDTGTTFENLARNPETYLDQKVKFNGLIIQVIKGSGYSQFRFAVDDNYDQIILIEISEDQLTNNRLLENDHITVRGTSFGEITYTSTMGGEITIPGVVVDSFERY